MRGHVLGGAAQLQRAGRVRGDQAPPPYTSVNWSLAKMVTAGLGHSVAVLTKLERERAAPALLHPSRNCSPCFPKAHSF